VIQFCMELCDGMKIIVEWVMKNKFSVVNVPLCCSVMRTYR
jgi:hypothetical protein